MRLSITIELAGDGRSERQPGPSISRVWFTRDNEAGNREHARQLVIQRLRPLLDELAGNGVHQRTVGVPIVPALDAAVEAALRQDEPTRLHGR
ncbi:MAG TPA: hypothetical protein VHF45_04940 [Thermoleophilaceae bacterium]|nr:hypothetical protein [Thermoleophilaceae bacterium]